MKMKEWKISLPSGQCPFADFPYNYNNNCTDVLCNLRRAKEKSDIYCNEDNCHLQISEAQLFDGLYLTDVNESDLVE